MEKKIVLEHNIHEKMISNFEQTPVGLTFLNKTTHTGKGSECVSITNVDDKRQTTVNFASVNLGIERMLKMFIQIRRN